MVPCTSTAPGVIFRLRLPTSDFRRYSCAQSKPEKNGHARATDRHHECAVQEKIDLGIRYGFAAGQEKVDGAVGGQKKVDGAVWYEQKFAAGQKKSMVQFDVSTPEDTNAASKSLRARSASPRGVRKGAILEALVRSSSPSSADEESKEAPPPAERERGT